MAKRKLKNYLFWHTAKHFSQNVKKSLQKENDCFADTTKAFPFAIGATFVRNRSDSVSRKNFVETMATSMKEALKDNWSNANGLDDEPHIRLLNKVDAMSMLIGTYLLLNWSYFV